MRHTVGQVLRGQLDIVGIRAACANVRRGILSKPVLPGIESRLVHYLCSSARLGTEVP